MYSLVEECFNFLNFRPISSTLSTISGILVIKLLEEGVAQVIPLIEEARRTTPNLRKWLVRRFSWVADEA